MRDRFWSYDRDRGWVVRQRPTSLCPKCGSLAVRVARRPVDRLYSLIRPVRRYQCSAQDCRWIGNLAGEIAHIGEPRASAAVWAVPFIAGVFAVTTIGLALFMFVF